MAVVIDQAFDTLVGRWIALRAGAVARHEAAHTDLQIWIAVPAWRTV